MDILWSNFKFDLLDLLLFVLFLALVLCRRRRLCFERLYFLQTIQVGWLIMFSRTKRRFFVFVFSLKQNLFSRFYHFFLFRIEKSTLPSSSLLFLSLNQWSHNGRLTYILLRCNKWKSDCRDRRLAIHSYRYSVSLTLIVVIQMKAYL